MVHTRIMGLKLLILAVFVFYAAMAGPAMAESGPDQETVALNDMVVTATRFPVKAERVAGRIRIISEEQIGQMPFERVDELLQQIPGVASTRTAGIFELSPQVSMRGLGGNRPGRTLVLIDGVPASVGDTGNMRWNRINQADIRRIEVHKGPGSSIYGSNAMGGVINIITKRPEKRFSGEAWAGYGSFSTKKGGFRMAGEQAPDRGFYGQAALTALDSDGYTALTPASRDYDARRDRFVEEVNLNTKLGYRISSGHTLELSHFFYDDRRGEGVQYHIDQGSHRDFDTQGLNLAYKGDTDTWQWRFNGFFQREAYYWHRDFPRLSSLYTVNSDRDDYGGTASVSRRLGEASILVAGADMRISRVEAKDDYDNSDNYAGNEGQLDQYGLYLQNELNLMDDRLVLVAGLRYDTAKFSDGAYASNIFPFDSLTAHMESSRWDAFSPKLSARYLFSDRFSIYGSYARGFRAPILDSLCRNGIFHGRFYDANPNLENEVLDNFEIGADTRISKDLTLALSGYYSLGKDFIYSLDTGEKRFLWGRNRSVYSMDNLTEVEILGLEAELDWRINAGLSLFCAYTFNHSTIQSFDRLPELEGKTLEYVPEHSFSAGVTIFTPVVNLKVVVNHVGDQYTNDVNTKEISGYETVDLKFWKDLDFPVPGIRASLKIQNLLDETYLRIEDTESPGINALAEIRYAW